MENKALSKQSKTPNRNIIAVLSEESKFSNPDFSNIENTSYNVYSNIINPSHNLSNQEEWNSSEQDSLSYLKFEVETKQQLINDMSLTQNELRQTLSTLKAQNNSLHNELNNCRNKNYELDVQIYLLKETIASKDKEIQKIITENESLKNSERNIKSLKEENNMLQEEIKINKVSFETKLKQSLQKIDELLKALKENNEVIYNLKQKISKEEGAEGLFSKKNTKSLGNLKINDLKPEFSDLGFDASEKKLNMTERGVQSSASIVSDIMKILLIDSPKKILSAVIHLKEAHKKHIKYRKFFKKLSLLVIDCSPSGYFKEKPNIPQVWRWITLFLEEYMKLSQSKNLF